MLGILGKVGGFIVSIPDPVLGGMTTFLFANVLCSGMKILIDGGGGLTRRNRFIVAATFACGSASRLLCFACGSAALQRDAQRRARPHRKR